VRRTELGLREYGPVLWPAYSGAEILGVRMSTPGGPPEPDDQYDEALPPDGEAAAGEPLATDEHSARYDGQHDLYVLRSQKLREELGLAWLARPKGTSGMATLDEKMAEITRIKGELQRMENDESVTEEQDGDLRDTLIARYRKLKDECAPIIARMKEIQEITRAAEDEVNTEPGADDGTARRWDGTPELVTRTHRDPYDNNEAIRSHIVTGSELLERSLDAVELENKRSYLAHDAAEEVTRKIQDYGNTRNNNIAEHVLLTGSPEYQDTFRAYLQNPQREAQRAALSLTLANGGFRKVAAAAA
jgi:hypothetical protein